MRMLGGRLSLMAIFLWGCCCVPLPALAEECILIPIAEQLQVAELRTDEVRADEPQYAENNYRRRLLRFVNSYYSNIAEELLRGQGDYLLSLHRLMGSSSDSCTLVYRKLLLQEVNSQDFGIALWMLRMPAIATNTTTAQTWAVPACMNCNVTERKPD
ncbi:MAG TPA: hypothetical protein VLB90_10660 [Pseudomonadales bacterium]|nr:hypothetical protein [Pseudomonadales bacterium]